MASTIPYDKNTQEINFPIILHNLNQFKDHQSEVFYVQQKAYRIKFATDRSKKYLCICLQPGELNDLKIWSSIVKVGIKLFSFKLNMKHYLIHFSTIFCSAAKKYGLFSCISLDELMDLNNGFVSNNTCVMEISVSSSQVQNITSDDVLPFKIIEYCSKATYQIKVERSNNLISFNSPEFRLNNMPWQIVLFQTDFNKLQANLFNISCLTSRDLSCQTSIMWKLVSYDKNIQFLMGKMEKEFKFGSAFHSWDIIDVKRLLTPISPFVENNAFVLEVTIEVDNINNRNDTGKRIKCSCAICFESLFDRDISSIPCGHIFCYKCILESLKRKNECPSCNQDTELDKIRPVLLQPSIE